MTVYGYARVSTERQADEGVSLEEQIRRIEGRALEQGWLIAETFIERGISGSVPLGDRPEGARLVAALQAGDVVIAAKLDRMFRSAWDALNVIRDFQRRRISLWLLDLGGDVSGDGIAKLVLTILDLYKIIIIAGAILSWLIAFGVVNIRNDIVRSVWNLFVALTEPFLRPIRNFLPNTGGIDISPIILLLAIMFIQWIIQDDIAPLFY